MHSELYREYEEQVIAARQARQPLVIQGGNSKYFYGREVTGDIISTQRCTGIIAYEPTELVVTAHAGTPLQELEKTLSAKGQKLAFEPPCFTPATTIGGVVASGLAGPARPYLGGVRDYVLGVKCLTGRAEIQTFGGQVMKNVAGYDVSRLMTGAMGTLGLLLEVSVKVMPVCEYEMTLTRMADFDTALDEMNEWAGKPVPVTATSYDGRNLNIRLSGKKVAVEAAASRLGLENTVDWPEYWSRLRDHLDPFFMDESRPLWRISVPPMTPPLPLSGDWLLEWGGALRWLKSHEPVAKIREQAARAGGHATLFRRMNGMDDVFQPLPEGIMRIHQRLKEAFDPDGVLNPGRMYADL